MTYLGIIKTEINRAITPYISFDVYNTVYHVGLVWWKWHVLFSFDRSMEEGAK